MVSEQEIWKILEEVNDPEVPVLSVTDLGIIRSVKIDESTINITITPTYSGCPAMDIINMDIRLKMIEKGYANISILQSLSPAWTTDWMSDEGRRKLKEYGIAPPNPRQSFGKRKMFTEDAVLCPHCNSSQTQLISQFGSTACKSLYRCITCKEPFDYFKCH